MATKTLSVIIPSRNEMFTKKTVEDLLEHKRGDTEIIVGLDGQWADPPIEQHPDVNVIYYHEAIGQRAISNQCAKLAKGYYVMKVDAHCSFDEGFDVKMMDKMEDDITMVPVMRNLWAFDWICPDGHTRYQSPSGPCKFEYDHCPSCDSIKIRRMRDREISDEDIRKLNSLKDEKLSLEEVKKRAYFCRRCGTKFLDNESKKVPCGKPTTRDIKWIGKTNPQSVAYRFDRTMHFQYWNPFGKEQKGDLTETMSLQGSCFMSTKKKYFELDLCDEGFGSWGQQGVEVACKTWLSGGRVFVNRTTWYAHMFRTQGGDFGFPYNISGRQVDKARQHSRDLFINDKWPKAIHPFRWLIEKFNPPDWEAYLSGEEGAEKLTQK